MMDDEDEVDDGCNGVNEDDEDDAQASKIQATVWWIPFGGKLLLQITFGGEVSWFFFVSVTLIWDPSSQG